MTVRYWKNRKDGRRITKTLRLGNGPIGTLIALYIFARYDGCEIDTIGEIA